MLVKNIDKFSSIIMQKMHTHTHTHTRTHTHTVYRLIGVKDNVAELKYSEK